MKLLKALVPGVLGIFIISLFSGCALFKPAQYKETQFVMDTIVEITAYGPNSKEAVQKAFLEFKKMDLLCNRFNDDSQVSLINRNAGNTKVQVNPTLIELLKSAKHYGEVSDGAFDVTIGPLTDLWGIGRKDKYVPTDEEIEALRPLVSYNSIMVDTNKKTVFLPKKGMILDLGGIAKGYATDQAIKVLKENNIKSALINAGGNVRVIGTRTDKKPWTIGIQDPRNNDNIIAKLPLTTWDSLQTSGDYQRYIMVNYIRYAHIISPKTGKQPREIISVTIMNVSSVEGDFLSTAVFVLGVDEGLNLLKKFPHAEALIVKADNSTIITPGLEGKIQIGDIYAKK